MPARRLLVVLAAAAVATASCTTTGGGSLPGPTVPLATSTTGPQSPASSATGGTQPSGTATSSAVSPSPSTSAGTVAGTTKTIARTVHADELGVVPVLMYHQLVATPGKDRYNETPAAFLAELTRLERDGYVPITAAQFAAGAIDVPAGKHPVVLTFDDATTSQFQLGADDHPVPDCAVGIMQAFAETHPDFPARATFFVNKAPFAQTPNPLQWLTDNGFEVAVHTVSHANLGTLTDAKVQKEIGDNFQTILAATGKAPTTFALPYGVHARNRVLELRGTSGGKSYSISGVFLVGSDPSKSPFRKGFDVANIHRIRSQSTPGGPNDQPYESAAELTVLEQHPERLYTSDGDPKVVSYPRSRAKDVGTLPAGLVRNAY
ncbi:MAG: hypothetical protein QOC60_426 [Frankiaceae bacterium]|nr:hypothetical protein [Frankiaceae bacterium]